MLRIASQMLHYLLFSSCSKKYNIRTYQFKKPYNHKHILPSCLYVIVVVCMTDNENPTRQC